MTGGDNNRNADADAVVAGSAEPALAELARALRHRRQLAGLSHSQLAGLIGYSRQYVSVAERANKAGLPSVGLIQRIDETLRAGGELVKLHSLAAQARQRRRQNSAEFPIGGQRCDATSASSNEEEVVETHAGRTFLQSLSGIAVSALTGEFEDVLIVRGDIKPIEYFTAARRTLVDNDNIFGPRAIIQSAERQISRIIVSCDAARGVDLVPLLEIRTRFAEFVAWLHQDLGNHATAKFWLDRALDWSYLHPGAELSSYILARKSQLAGDLSDPMMGIGVGELAIKSAPTPRIAAIASVYTAHSYALNGSDAAAERLYESARSLASQDQPSQDQQSPRTLGSWLDQSYIDVHRAGSINDRGQHDVAAEIFMRAIDHLPSKFHRDKGVYLARAANAYAGADGVDEAVHVGMQAVHIAIDTYSGRILSELDRLSLKLAEVRTPAVVALQAAVNSVRMNAATL